MTSANRLLNQNGAVHMCNFLPIEFCQYFTHTLLFGADNDAQKGDVQVPNCKAVLNRSIVFETLQERFWPVIEQIAGEELLPTYAYARLYTNGDVLEAHTDRPTCEISVTIQLGRSHHYAWPIYMGGVRYDMGEGDAIIYKGHDIEHWRQTCDGPNNYYSGQAFLHYVKKNGKYASLSGDSENRTPANFIKNRTVLMEQK